MNGIGSRMRLPLAGCDRNIASSSGVSLPGLFSLSLRMPILPTSCIRPNLDDGRDLGLPHLEADGDEARVHGHPFGVAARVAVGLLQRVGKADDGLLEVLLQRDVGPGQILVGVDQVFVQARVLDRHRRAAAQDVQHLALALAELGAARVAVHVQHPDDAPLELQRDGTEADQPPVEIGRRRQEAKRPAAVHQERAVLVEDRQHLFQVQRGRLGVGSQRGEILRIRSMKRPSRLGSSSSRLTTSASTASSVASSTRSSTVSTDSEVAMASLIL